MTQHKESGQCANIVLDRAEANDHDQLRQVIERSAFEVDVEGNKNNYPASAVQSVPIAPVYRNPGVPAGGDVDMDDENEREIARIL